MASIALSVVGFAIGGPFGAAIGSFIGQQLDPLIFGSGPGREGPRLKELDVQTSSYGTAIPRVYGRMRLAGTVIWATDLKESKRTQGAKGQPDFTTYSYSCSFAVALSSRPIVTIGRIWADGRLIRGADNNLTVEGRLRIHDGRGDNAADPLIAAAEGTGQTPAHRGLAYAVFEELQLADFGNRIPALTFEVIGDSAALDARLPLADVAGITANTALPPMPLVGFAATGEDRRTGIAPLLGALPLVITDDGRGGLTALADASAAPITDSSAEAITAAEPLYDPESPGGYAGEVSNSSAARLARSLSLRHYDPARDYQAGLQQADRPGADGRAQRIDLPAALTSDSALALVRAALDRQGRQRERWQGRIALPDLPLLPGQTVALPLPGGAARHWRVTAVEHGAEFLAIEAVASGGVSGGGQMAARSDSGRALLSADTPPPPTRALLIELPALAAPPATMPRLIIAACGSGPGWRGAAAGLRRGEALVDLGSLPRGAVLGTAATILPPASPWLEDRRSNVVVALAGPHLAMADADGDLLGAGANLAMLGNELIQFARAEPLGGSQWRLSGLRRGLAGTDHEVGSHIIGEPFLLMSPGSALLVPDGLAGGAAVQAEVIGLADTAPLLLDRIISGAAVRPLSPVHGRHWQDGTDHCFAWIRRSRSPLGWTDGADLPLAEERERYALEWRGPDDGVLITAVVDTPTATRPHGIATSGSLHVRQIGTHAQSLPLTISF